MANIIHNLGFKNKKLPPHYINEIRITPVINSTEVQHTLYIRSGLFEFTGHFDNNLHHFWELCSVAMKYFGVKYGIVTIDSEGNTRPTNKGMH